MAESDEEIPIENYRSLSAQIAGVLYDNNADISTAAFSMLGLLAARIHIGGKKFEDFQSVVKVTVEHLEYIWDEKGKV